MAGTAIFDLDRTLTRKGTWTRFLFYANGARPGFLIQLPWLVLRGLWHKLGFESRDSFKALCLNTLSSMDRITVENKARAFAAREVASGLRPSARKAIDQHLARGDRLILATAAVDILADPLGEMLGFHCVLATKLRWHPNGAYSGPALETASCYGPEKLRRIQSCEANTPLAAPVYAYSDHISDLDLLLRADQGYAVNPCPKLHKVAKEQAIEVIDFDQSYPTLSD